ncbi:MAG TPA: oxidoreductase, partial [Actinomycetota bacterium]|nr:oxidoreductase [Actinomycetota bacterium]
MDPLSEPNDPCPERDTRAVDVAVVGAGRVGTAIAVLLRRAGHRIVAVAGGSGTPARAARHLPGVPATDGP